jgi:hypothetical protein
MAMKLLMTGVRGWHQVALLSLQEWPARIPCPTVWESFKHNIVRSGRSVFTFRAKRKLLLMGTNRLFAIQAGMGLLWFDAPRGILFPPWDLLRSAGL